MGGAGPAEYSIAAVSKLTGVSCHALRVWERRYGFPVPRRSPSGHRRYGADQVEALRLIAALAGGGRAIGDVIAEYLARRPEAPQPSRSESPEVRGPTRSALVDALLAGDEAAADAEYNRLAADLGPVERIDRLIEPCLVDCGERWFRGQGGAFQEHLASGFLRRKLAGLLEDAHRANARPGRSALVGTLQGDRHEGGVLIVSVILELSGWRALNVGVDLPVREYARAIEAWRPDALALSFVMSRNINKRFRELGQLEGLPVFVGGRSIVNYQGLARRHGLIPLPGPASRCIEAFLSGFEDWRAARARPSPP